MEFQFQPFARCKYSMPLEKPTYLVETSDWWATLDSTCCCNSKELRSIIPHMNVSHFLFPEYFYIQLKFSILSSFHYVLKLWTVKQLLHLPRDMNPQLQYKWGLLNAWGQNVLHKQEIVSLLCTLGSISKVETPLSSKAGKFLKKSEAPCYPCLQKLINIWSTGVHCFPKPCTPQPHPTSSPSCQRCPTRGFLLNL